MNVKAILEDEGENSFYELYKRVGLPDNLFHATETLMCVLNSLDDELSKNGIKISERDSKRIISNLMMYAEEEGEIENLEYIITLIQNAAQRS